MEKYTRYIYSKIVDNLETVEKVGAKLWKTSKTTVDNVDKYVGKP
jgi:hypothetical protein